MGRDGKGWEEMGRDGKGWEGMGREGRGWEGMGRDGRGWEEMARRGRKEKEDWVEGKLCLTLGLITVLYEPFTVAKVCGYIVTARLHLCLDGISMDE